MFGLSKSTRVFLQAGVTALRLGFEGLHALVIQQLGEDPLSGHLFVFCNRSRTRVKLLFWDGSGFWLCIKRLEKGTFAWTHDGKVELNGPLFGALISGLEIKGTRAWYRQ